MVQPICRQWWQRCYVLLLLIVSETDGLTAVSVSSRLQKRSSSESSTYQPHRRVSRLYSYSTPESQRDPEVDSSQPTVDTFSSASIVASEDEDIKNYRLRFGGVARLLASQASSSSSSSNHTVDLILNRLRQATVVVIGLGGVGSWAAEALARSGIGTLVLIDLDDVCISNTNRQSHALATTVGQMKINAVRDRVLHINPNCSVVLIHDFVTRETIDTIFEQIQEETLIPHPHHGQGATSITTPMIVLDAIDGARDKAAILSYCDSYQLPVVTCGGAAGRSDPTLVRTTDLTLVDGDKLVALCKKELRKHYSFQAGLSFRERQKGRRVARWNIDCVHSEEFVAALPPSSSSSFRLCDGALGTACFLTGTFGFAAAAAVVKKIAHQKLAPPKGRCR